ncbi:MAG: hypothetical protein F6K42_19485, partial [Leptolyngbya sp. SIO1D8]|nr:hypothetical protein [Leptolyngbya sp. SIO1D8]
LRSHQLSQFLSRDRSGTRCRLDILLCQYSYSGCPQKVRALLPDVPILASGDLDEYEICRLKQAGAYIDGYGLGTRLVSGSPVNGVYKLVEMDGTPVMKESASKVTYPGCKQIFRQYEGDRIIHDALGLASETHNRSMRPLLSLFMQRGELVAPLDSLNEIAQRTAQSVTALPSTVRKVTNPNPFPVELTPALTELTQATRHQPVPCV